MGAVKTSRRAKALATRRAILRAAHEEFAAKGFRGATVVDIASRAGVSNQTVYFVFHTKVELISAVIDAAVMGEDDKAPQETTWWADMRTEPDAAAALRTFVVGAAESFRRASAVSEVLRAAALNDDELRARYDAHERLRYEAFTEVVQALAAKEALRRGLTVRSATEVLMTVLGDSTYHRLRSQHGWDHETVVAWWTDALPLLLLENPSSAGGLGLLSREG